MNPIDYWYQKYLNSKLTWKDIAIIITIYETCIENGIFDRNGSSSNVQVYSQEILQRFNDIKNR